MLHSMEAMALVALQVLALTGPSTEHLHANLPRGWPKRGCEYFGGAPWPCARCTLPAGRVMICANREVAVTIECEPAANRGAGRFQCEELETARAALRTATHAAPRAVSIVNVVRCEPHGPLRCVLDVAGAHSADVLRLERMTTELRPEHLDRLNVTSIEIFNAGNKTRMPYAALATVPQLRKLSVTNAEGLAEGWRPTLEHLENLELSKFVEIPARAFEGLPKLKSLALWGYTIEHINKDAFANLSVLDTLHLKSMAIKSLPPGLLLPMSSLRTLRLSDGSLQYVSRAALHRLQHLENVYITNGNTTELQLEAGTLADLPMLRKLVIENSGLRVVTADLLRGSRGLEELSLKDNSLVEVPGELLADQVSLRTLNLAHNFLETLPQNLFSSTIVLQELYLSNNAIKFLPDVLFYNLRYLTVLELSHNRILQVNWKALENLRALVRLSLSHNAISELKLRYWQSSVYLKTLDLSYNLITEFSMLDVTIDSQLLLILGNNKIKKVSFVFNDKYSPYNVFVDSSAAPTFLLGSNPYVCDCNMYKFITALGNLNIARRFFIENAQCAAPVALAGRGLSTLLPNELSCELDAFNCPVLCTCALRPATAYLELTCDKIPYQLPPLTPLNVSAARLRLRSVPADLAALPPEVRLVDLSGLELTIAPTALTRVEAVTVDLRNNKLTKAPVSLFDAKFIVRLAGNDFECDCEHRDNIATLEKYWSQIEDGSQIRCRGGGHVVSLRSSRLCAMRDAIVLGGSLAAVGLALAALGALAFRYSTEIRLVLRRFEVLDFLFEEPPDPTTLEKEYDAFVSFSHRDDDFVRDELVPQLEGGRRPLRLCLHYRDWEIGGLIPEQIARSVHESRRTIVVLSREFLQSVWGRVEFRAAHGLERVILLLRGDVLRDASMDPELRAYLTTNTYVHADDPLVWDRVRDAVLRSRRPRPPAAPAVPALPAATSAIPMNALPAAPVPALPAANTPASVLALANIVTSANVHTVNTRNDHE